MGSEDNEVNIYDYRGGDIDPNVQAYLVHYPIANMKLDLQEYVDEALVNDDGEPISFEIPHQYSDPTYWNLFNGDPEFNGELFLTGDDDIQTSEGEPTFKIELVDMARLVKEVDGTFGFETSYDQSLEAHLQVKIPAFGITGYISGVKQGNKLQFLSEENTTINPQADLSGTNGFLYIYIKMTGPCSGQIESGVVFEWTDAVIDTVDENFDGEYPIENSLKEFLGSGVNFKEVKSYIYVDGIEDDGASLILDHVYIDENNTVITDELANGELEPKTWEPVTGDSFDKSLSDLPHSYIDEEFIDLTDVLNSNEASKLKYQILIEEMEVVNDGDNLSKSITADLVILLVMDFEVSDEEPIFEGYSKLDMGGALPDPGDKDFFAREGNDDDLLSNVEMVKITLINIEKGVIDGKLAILVVNPDHNTGKVKKHLINIDSPDPSLTLYMNDLPFPFTPKFEILLKNELGEDYAEFKIKHREPGDKPFGFSLTVEARADLNYTVEF